MTRAEQREARELAASWSLPPAPAVSGHFPNLPRPDPPLGLDLRDWRPANRRHEEEWRQASRSYGRERWT